MNVLIFQRMLIELVLDIVYFPIWWYTAGARHALLFCVGLVRQGNMQMAPGLWLKNIFVPMFGQYDWQGRIVSFMMRFFNVIFRSIGLFVWTLVCFVLFVLGVIFPMFVIYMLLIAILSFGSSPF